MSVALRVVHPFPSLLDAAVTVAVASLAGAVPAVAARLGVAMLVLQFSIGAANDVADRERDAVAQTVELRRGGIPSKPVAAGLISPAAAVLLSVALAAAGILLSATVGTAPSVLAAAGLGIGLLYDLRLKGTAWSWLPFAVGVALLPAYAWWGGAGHLPGVFVPIFMLALAAGASLAVANAICDLAVDSAAGIGSIATALGRTRALSVNAVLLACVHVVVLGTLAAAVPVAAGVAAVAIGGMTVGWLGLFVTARPRRRRQLGWEIQAAGLAVAAVGWIGALVAAGALRS